MPHISHNITLYYTTIPSPHLFCSISFPQYLHIPYCLTYTYRQSRNNKDAVYLLEALAEGRYVQPSFLVDVHAPSVQGLYYGLGLREKKVVATSSTFSDSNVLNTMKGLYFRLARLSRLIMRLFFVSFPTWLPPPNLSYDASLSSLKFLSLSWFFCTCCLQYVLLFSIYLILADRFFISRILSIHFPYNTSSHLMIISHVHQLYRGVSYYIFLRTWWRALGPGRGRGYAPYTAIRQST